MVNALNANEVEKVTKPRLFVGFRVNWCGLVNLYPGAEIVATEKFHESLFKFDPR